jgi:ankyrin repeat protein
MMSDAIDPRLHNRLDTNMWRVAAAYLPAADIAQLARCCRYFNETVVWHPHSARILWAAMLQSELNKILCRDLTLSQTLTLITAGATPNAQISNGMTALMCACYRGRADTVRALLSSNADPNVKDNIEDTALIIACRRTNNANIVRALLSAGANVNASNCYGYTALTCTWKSLDIVRELLAAGANVNVMSRFGHTALSGAVDKRIIAALIEAGAQNS